MKRLIFSVLLSICLISFAGRAFSQGSITNSTGMSMWPSNPYVGIGTQLSGGALNALHIHYDASPDSTKPAMIRLSEGASTGTVDFGLLGLMPVAAADTMYSSLTRGNDLILHDHQDGDIIITNFSTPTATHTYGTAIRLATTGDTLLRSSPSPGHHDLERETILGNGNIGFDLPPNDTTGLGTPYEQLQLGGGSFPLTGYLDPMPGLSFYGGNRFEGMPWSGIGNAAVDYRFINFNYYHNPWTGTKYRMARMSSSAVAFSQVAGGMVQIIGMPYDSTLGKNDLTHNTIFQISGQQGLSLWTYIDSLDPYHHIFDVYPPGYLPWGVTRCPVLKKLDTFSGDNNVKNE